MDIKARKIIIILNSGKAMVISRPKFLNLGEDSIVVVKFNTGKVKSLMVKYAKLSKIS